MKNTAWNRLFHKDRVRKNVELKQHNKRLIDSVPSFIKVIGAVSFTPDNPDSIQVSGVQTLTELFRIHKRMLAEGFVSPAIEPSSYGLVRAKSVEEMTLDNVFLGNIYGLCTKPISYWETCRTEEKSGGGFEIYSYLTVYQIMLMQYKNYLSSAVKFASEHAAIQQRQLESRGYWIYGSAIFGASFFCKKTWK